MTVDTTKAVFYHSGEFPPASLDYARLLAELLAAAEALARYDQALRGMHNAERWTKSCSWMRSSARTTLVLPPSTVPT